MISPPEEAPDGPPVGDSGLPGVKPGKSGSVGLGVPDAWLADSAFEKPAADVDRLAGDLDLYNTLALSGFCGSEYDYFANELARYGLAVIGSWVRSGLIFAKCRERGLGGLPPAQWELQADDVEELASETVGLAVVKFREKVLLTKKWDPRKGASLRTFFIGQCLIRFPNVYRSWLNQEAGRNAKCELTEDSHPSVRPHERALDGMLAQDELSKVEDRRVRVALVCTAAGWPQWEIAQELGVTEKTVERMLAHHRQRIRKRRSA